MPERYREKDDEENRRLETGTKYEEEDADEAAVKTIDGTVKKQICPHARRRAAPGRAVCRAIETKTAAAASITD